MLVKFLLKETDQNESRQVEHWIESDAANLAYFEELKKVWDNSLKLASTSKVDANKAWEKFQRQLETGNAVTYTSSKPRSGNWLKIAASLLILISLGYLIINKEKPSVPMLVSTNIEILTDTLPDGSTVTLNKRSSIAYQSKFKGDTREIELKGEAFFKVTPDKNKPFIVKVNDVIVTVVGTSFNVKTINGSTEVVVETGLVRVTKKGQTVELRANEKTIVSLQDSLIAPKPVDDQLYNYYRTKEFVCDATPLWKLVNVLNEAYDTKIELGSKRIGDLQLSTTFINSSLDEVIEVISQTFNLKVTRQSGKIILE